MPLQTILFDTSLYSLGRAKKWIRSHGYKLSHRNKQPELLGNRWRFRQADKSKHGGYYSKKIEEGITMVFY